MIFNPKVTVIKPATIHNNKDPEIYMKYFDKLLQFLKNADNLFIIFHNFRNEDKIVYENKNI